MKRLIRILSLSAILLTASACERHSMVWKEMDIAEDYMATHPDSALAILERISIPNLNGGKETARYALLRSMALDKNLIDTTTFDVLQPAIDYYLRRGNVDEKLRTYYYQGRIYQNQGDDDASMRSFMNALHLQEGVTDSATLARTHVALGVLFIQQYKTEEFVYHNNAAANLYQSLGKSLLAIKSYTNALDGYVIMANKSAADSLMSICVPLVQENPDGEAYLFASMLSYTVEFGSPDEIKAFLDAYQDVELTTDETIDFAQGYSRIGEYDKAMTLLSAISPDGSILDTLKYASVKIEILEGQGKYEQALNLYKDYSAMLERHHSELLSQDLLFSVKKHQLEVKSLIEIQDRDRIIWATLCSIFGLVILVGWLYYRGYLSRTKRILAEKEIENLRLEQDNLRKEKEKAELERDKRILEAENLENDKKRLEAEKRQHELETANFKLEIAQLESERDNLKELQQGHSELSNPVQEVIKNRLDMLNCLLAKEITRNNSYAEPYNKWIETVHSDKQRFMASTRVAFAASHPKFMEHLTQHGLSTDEINYLCLYAIGLRGKEVGEYIQLKRHYIISHEIRKKLGIDEHETNIGLYVRKLMKDSER